MLLHKATPGAGRGPAMIAAAAVCWSLLACAAPAAAQPQGSPEVSEAAGAEATEASPADLATGRAAAPAASADPELQASPDLNLSPSPPEVMTAPDPKPSLLLILSTQYRARGISQTENRPAVLAILDVPLTSNIYVGAFFSNVSIEGLNPEAEFDYRAGYRLTKGKLSASFEAVYVDYLEYDVPSGAASIRYFELRNGLRYDASPVTLSVSFWHSPDFAGRSGRSYYVEAGAEYRSPSGFTFSGVVGHDWVERNDLFGFPDWLNWNLSVSHPVGRKVIATLGIVGTDIPRAECVGGQDICSSRIVASLSRKF